MGNEATKDPRSYVLDVGGEEITGLGPDPAMRWAETQPTRVMSVGQLGFVAHGKVVDDTATLEVDIVTTSDGNDLFTKWLVEDRNTEGGVAMAVTLRDISGREEFSCGIAFLAGNPARSVLGVGTVNTWSIIGRWSANVAGRGPTTVVDAASLRDPPDVPTPTPPT